MGPTKPSYAELRSRAADAIRYLGVGDIHRVAQVLQETTVFTTAPRASHRWNEQYGLAYLEAMASGVPVVTTICGTNHEAVVPRTSGSLTTQKRSPRACYAMLDPQHRALVSTFNRAHVLANHDMLTQASGDGTGLRPLRGPRRLAGVRRPRFRHSWSTWARRSASVPELSTR